jgi:hypothetical protein
MKRSHRLTAIAASLALAAGGAACGDDDDGGDGGADPDAYIEELNNAQLDYVNSVTEVISGAPPANPNALADAATDLETITEDSADEIEAIEPAEEVADLHEDFVGEMRSAASEFGEAADAFESGDPQEIQDAATQLQTASTEVQTNLQQIVADMNEALQN